MFGIMGCDAGFINAAKAKAQKGNMLVFVADQDDPMIHMISCNGEISIKTTKNGSSLTQTYSNLSDEQVSIQSDANTNIYIIGDLIKFSTYNFYPRYTHIASIDVSKCTTLEYLDISGNPISSIDVKNNIELQHLGVSSRYITALDLSANTALTDFGCSGCTGLTALDLSANTALTSLSCSRCTGLTALDLSANTALTSLGCDECTGLTALDLSANTALTNFGCGNCSALTTIKYPATNEDVSTAIADAITNATADDGTVYTDSAADYYQTIADAATAKGWTIGQL